MRISSVFLLSIGVVAFFSCRTEPEEPINARFLLTLDSTQLLVSEVATDLVEPWEILWGPDGHIWFTEHRGYVSRLNPKTGLSNRLIQVPNLHYERTSGVLSMVLHPDFERDPYIYVHYTIDNPTPNDPERITSEVVRFLYEAKLDTLISPDTLLANIPGKPWHNGSRMTLTPDRKIILSTGDIGEGDQSQNANALTGKMLRMNLDGSIPEDNPNPESYVYSIGHRNAQGLVYANNRIYSSEHGPNNDDEINIVKAGKNYGWPDVEGFCNTANEKVFCSNVAVTEPIWAWTPTIAPSGMGYFSHSSIPEWQNSLILASLKGRSIRVLHLSKDGETITEEKVYLQKLFGRMRDICISPDGDVYIATSNTDWHPISQVWMYDSLPKPGDDRIIKLSATIPDQVNKAELQIITADSAMQMFDEDYELMASNEDPGTSLYVKNCASCHLPDGKGIPGLIPPLVGSEWVTEDYERLIAVTVNGISGEIEVSGKTYNEIMPGFGALLEDDEIAKILNFVTSEFGTGDQPISEKEVRSIRNTNSN